jgi:hypothetical protein
MHHAEAPPSKLPVISRFSPIDDLALSRGEKK